jgi:cell division protein YceG involved in septum cleavage
LKRLIAPLVALLVFTFALSTIHNKFLLNDYRSTTSSSQVDIVIKDGETGTQIAQKLEKAGVIKASKVFYKVAINDKRSNSISPGIHEVDIKISARSALDQLLDPKRNRGLFGFIEGLRKAEILDLLVKSKLASGKLSPAVKPDALYKTSNLEGFLFPAQYSFSPGTLIDDAVNQTLTRSINTTLTVLLTLSAIFFFGGETLHNFSLALIVGFTMGAYSSIFIASTLLIWWRERSQNYQVETPVTSPES